ncbi:MAG: HIT domain-containing protein [Candidatus ainarchaeum sp.]|nr:HIT domain-containing protein [Candidatus ainarchaeum sp.]
MLKKEIKQTSKINSCLFCDFVSGKWIKHKPKFTFEKLFETKLTLSFLSIDFPSPKRVHVLIIPKKHYVNLQDCPKKVLHELIEHVVLVSKALRLEHEGSNILLNDGRGAEQTVMHTHFHLVPRNKGDGIEIELWKRVNISQKSYSKLNKEVKKLILKANKKK